MKKLLAIICIITLIFAPGCARLTSDSEVNPSITYTKGRFLDTNPPIMEGRITDLTDETITIKIEDVNYTLTLSKRAKEEIVIFRDKYNTPVEVDAFMQIKYEQKGEEYIANNLLFLEGNYYIE